MPVASTPQEFIQAFSFSLEVEGEMVGITEALVEHRAGDDYLIMKTGVVVGERRLRNVGKLCLTRLVNLTSMNRTGKPIERLMFAASEVERYVYGRWDANKSEILMEELHLKGKVTGIV